jgi:outer membrane protein assembly factor BamB
VFGEFKPRYNPPQHGRAAVRPVGHPARRLIIILIVALVTGALLGLVIMLQFKGWSALSSEAALGCGSRGGNGPCSRGIDWAVGWTIPVGSVTVLTVGLLLLIPPSRRWLLATGTAGRSASAAVLIVGVAGGLLAGQSLFSIWHGTDLSTAWTAPSGSSPDLTTVGAWADARSLVRVRVDQVVSYDGATGLPRWTLPIPGTDVACSASSDTGSDGAGTIGLVMYGSDSGTCDHVMAVDLATGHQAWAAPVQSPASGDSAPGVLGVADGTAVVLTGGAVTGLDARTGAKRWTLTSRCDFQQLYASGDSAVALAACDGASYDVVSIDPATGKAAWQYNVTEPSDDYQFQILAASPVVVSDALAGPRSTTEVRVFGPGGAVTATFPVSGIPDPGTSGHLALDIAPTDGFGVPAVIADGTLVGIAQGNDGDSALVSFALSSGKQQWLDPLPDKVHDITAGGSAQPGEVILVDESNPAYSLEEAGLGTGKLRSLGYFRHAALESGDSALYAVGNDYLVVNLDGSGGNPPVAAITAPAATS